MFHKKKTCSLIVLLSAIMIAVLVICFFVFFLFTASRYTDFCYNLSKSFSSSISSQISNNISSDISTLESNLYSFINEPLIRDSICRDGESVPNQDFVDLFREYYDTTSMSYYYFSSFDLYAKNSGIHYTTVSNSLELENPFFSEYYHAALKAPTSFVWMGMNKKTNLLEISKILYNNDTFEVDGLLIIRLNPDFILDSFRNIKNLDFSRAYLLTPNGKIVLSTDMSLVNTYISDDMVSKIRSASGPLQLEDNQSVYIVNVLSNYYRRSDFLVMIQIENMVMTKDVDIVTRSAWFYVISILIAIIAVWAFISVVVSRKIKKLTEGFGRIEKGNFNGYIRLNSRVTEFATIAEGYNSMLAHLNHLIEDVYHERLISNEMRLKCLTAQINPHFLFNTLQLISLKSYSDSANIDTIIGHLSLMLGHSLDNRDSKFVRLSDELEYIKSYLYIIKCKFEDKIISSVEVPKKLMGCLIPSCTLQPLIENAIVHGLTPKFGQGHILLTAKREEDHLVIKIEDDGEGIPSEQLKCLMDNSSADHHSVDKIGHHMAIINIRKRLSILYANDYSFEIISKLYLGTKIVLKLPYRQENSNG